jgi:hypothetical protein
MVIAVPCPEKWNADYADDAENADNILKNRIRPRFPRSPRPVLARRGVAPGMNN